MVKMIDTSAYPVAARCIAFVRIFAHCLVTSELAEDDLDRVKKSDV